MTSCPVSSRLITMAYCRISTLRVSARAGGGLTDQLTIGKEVSINNIMHTWALDHKGHCFSCNIFVKIIPSLFNYEIISLVHKINDNDYILTDYDGEISGLGKKAAEYLVSYVCSHRLLLTYCCLLVGLPVCQPSQQLNVKKLKEYRVNIQLMAPKISEMYKDYFGDSEESVEHNVK